jgi:hypothetical protein
MSAGKKQGHWLLEFIDETSSDDPHGHYQYGSECYTRTYRAWIPKAISRRDEESIMEYLDRHPHAYLGD